jgi:hypothetical protein
MLSNVAEALEYLRCPEEKTRSYFKVDFWGQTTAISSPTRRKRVG